MELAALGDLEGQEQLFAADCVIHCPGRGPWAGDYRGFSEFRAGFAAAFAHVAIDGGLHDALGTDDHAVQLLRMAGTVGDRSHTWHTVWVIHVREGRFAEAWMYVDDPCALTDFLEMARSDGAGSPVE
jgi:ketosteroid isomerase-like protein